MMELTDLGFDPWFQGRAASVRQPGRHLARVTAVDRGGGLVRNERGEIYFELAGKLRFAAQSAEDLPCVGDWVSAQYHNSGEAAIIHGVLPRKTVLRRKCAGKSADYQLIAANLDLAFIVQSCHYDFNLRRLERYLVMANEGRIEPVIVLTKTDLIPPAALEEILSAIRQSGIAARTVAVSNVTGAGLDAFRQLLSAGKTYCLLGSSGVGKTTLINRLLGEDAFDTRAVSDTGEGTHMTARRQLVILAVGALLIDTPGMRELGLMGADDGIDESFAEIADLARSCRFADCRHAEEPGCSVRAAIERGELSRERYASYLKLTRESAYHALSYAEKREKDRAFGRFIKSAKTQMKRKGE